MIYVQKNKWEFKQQKDGDYLIKCKSKNTELEGFSFVYKTENFSCKNLKKAIKRKLKEIKKIP